MHDHDCCGHDHHHHHEEECGCGHEHHHEEECSCGHEHHHDEHCGCGHEHHHSEEPLTAAEERILHTLHHCHYLPIARFTLTSSKEDELFAVAMEPVYLVSTDTSMEDAKADSAPFASLEEKGLISLDYDIPLSGYDYGVYEQSELYRYFCETVKENAARPDALFDTPNLELGSVALVEEEKQHGN